MARLVGSFAMLVTVVCILSSSAIAQQASPKSCQDAQSMQNVNLTQIAGTWYEVARQPAAAECVKVDFAAYTVDKNSILNIQVTKATNPNKLNSNTTMSANVTLGATNTDGFNVTFTTGQTNEPPVILKLLETDYSNYTYVCGYTNASDPTTSFGAILTRQRTPNATVLNSYKEKAASQYSNFSTNQMSSIIQTSKCYTSGAASQNVSVLTTMFAIFFAVLKYFN